MLLRDLASSNNCRAHGSLSLGWMTGFLGMRLKQFPARRSLQYAYQRFGQELVPAFIRMVVPRCDPQTLQVAHRIVRAADIEHAYTIASGNIGQFVERLSPVQLVF